MSSLSLANETAVLRLETLKADIYSEIQSICRRANHYFNIATQKWESLLNPQDTRAVEMLTERIKEIDNTLLLIRK